MKRRPRSFNLYFSLVCLLLAAGCASDKQADEKKAHKKEQSTIRLYLEAHGGGTGVVLVTRQKIPMLVEREPFLTEADLKKASLVNEPDGTYAIQLVFDEHATLVLDMTSTSNKGRHIVIFTQFPPAGTKPAKEKKKKSDNGDDDEVELPDTNTPATQVKPVDPNQPRQSAWMAAILIREGISNGLLRFTPDTTHPEAVRIVRGLKNVIAKTKRNSFFDHSGE
jgi:hypothetical protein